MKHLGQLMMIGISGVKATPELKLFIRNAGIGGVILYKRNCRSPRQISRLIKSLQDAAEGALIIGVDEEGGRVSRLPEQFTKLPPMHILGDADPDGDLAYGIGEAMGRELASVGFNLNFAPVLDVSTDAFNPAIGDRAISSDPHVVAKFASEFIRGLQSSGIGACGKHFPGHGDTDVDSHLGLPVLNHTRRRFDECEFIPFRAAADAGVASMMTAHIMAPNLDPELPSSISNRVITGILRREIGFDGLIVSDDLMMKGIADIHPPSESAWRAIDAGNDIAMVCCEDIEVHRQAYDGLKRALDDGKLGEGRIQEAISCIEKFRTAFCANHEPPPQKVIGCRGHREIIGKISQ